jgi:hypothetical protein
MRARRWLLTRNVGLGAWLLSGCLRGTVVPDDLTPRADRVALAERGPKAESADVRRPPSNYQVSQLPPATKETPPTPPVKPVELRIEPQEAPAPTQPTDPPAPAVEARSAPAEADAPLVQALRSLLKRQPAGEVREPLKQYDLATQEALLVLLESMARLELAGGVEQVAPRDLATWVDRLDALAEGLRPRSQLMLQKTYFCSHIENFGKYIPLEDICFQPGQVARVYVQLKNVASRWNGSRFQTALKGRVEIYAENNHDKPVFVLPSKQLEYDFSRAPRHDYFVNIRFEVPPICPHGSYTVRICVEDWTDAPAGAKTVAPSRCDSSSLDFRVGGPIIRHPSAGIADVSPRR